MFTIENQSSKSKSSIWNGGYDQTLGSKNCC